MASIDNQRITRDTGRIRLGAAFRLPPADGAQPTKSVAPSTASAAPRPYGMASDVADSGRIRLGAAFRLIAG